MKWIAFIGIFFYYLFNNGRLYAQATDIKPLQIGDSPPLIEIYHLLNYKSDSLSLTDFKGKPIILDFFATWCGSCIKALSELNTLQDQFKGRVQIIVVTGQSSDKIKSFLQHNPNAKNVTLPFITDDSLLSRYFPHKMIPHEVWIDKNEKVAAITEYYYVTAANLQDLIAGKTLHLPLKKDVQDFTVAKPLLYDYRSNERQPYYTEFGRSIRGLPGLTLKQSDSSRTRFLATNAAVIELCQTALPGLKNRIILQVKDTSRYIWDRSVPYDQWAAGNCFCYEITVPPGTSKKSLHQYMLQDLNRYLGISIHKERRMVDCWALVRTGHGQAIQTHGGKPEHNLLDKAAPVKIFRNLPVSELISILNLQVPAYPIVPVILDETHCTGNIDLALKVDDIHDIPALCKALRPYGLDLVPVKRELEMYVLTDNNRDPVSPQ